SLLLLIILGIYCDFNSFFYLGVGICSLFFVRNYFLYKKLGITNCIIAFSANHWIGLIIFIIAVIQYIIKDFL
ncbi:4-hydroxybenzoate octaprenyltransferase, partial [Francisella tularensis subsp. holarctica]|nr:4-hydroxybenzoate octaprenyltransferase [Francisella tularensis subsp. holarctica]